MSRVQHSKPSRRLAWAAATVVLLALPTAASAQSFFFLFGSPPPYEIERQLAAAGYLVTGPLTLRGDVYIADVVVRGEGPERLVIDSHSGRIVERYRGRADHWREAAAAPPAAWGDDPSLWNGPRPPASVGPDIAPPDAFEPPKPNVLETPKAETPKPKPKTAETRPKWTPKPTPVANVNNPPPAAVVPPPAAKTPAAPPPVSSSPAAAPALPSPAPSAAAAPTSPAPAAAPPSPAPSIEAAKVDAPSVAKPPPSAPAPAKAKAVNDIPVTPLD
jgi:hypothetical protein